MWRVWMLWLCGCVPVSESHLLDLEVENLQERVAALEVEQAELGTAVLDAGHAVKELDHRTASMVVSGDTVTFEGVNVRIVDGSGDTWCEACNGLGNLVVGYGEMPAARTGSHNLVLGEGNSYTSYGGIVSGEDNAATAPNAAVLGGVDGIARGDHAVVVGGSGNVAAGFAATVTGGYDGLSSGYCAVVAGGLGNTASTFHATATGGTGNTASGTYALAAGGSGNEASGDRAVASGGTGNVAGGRTSVAGGGLRRSAAGEHDWAAGAFFADQ